jgi:hypothetical protein
MSWNPTRAKRLSILGADPRIWLLCVTLYHFLAMWLFVLRTEYHRYQTDYAMLCCEHWYPTLFWHDATLLFVATLSLWLRKPWGGLVAMLLSGRVLYLGYLFGMHILDSDFLVGATPSAFDFARWQAYFHFLYEHSLRNLFEVILAALIFLYAALTLSWHMYARHLSKRAGV